MLSDEEKREYEELKSLLYTGTISQYGKRKLIEIIEKQSKEIEELKDESKEYQIGFAQGCYERDLDWKDKIKAKIEEIDKEWAEGELDGEWYEFMKYHLQSLLEKE